MQIIYIHEFHIQYYMIKQGKGSSVYNHTPAKQMLALHSVIVCPPKIGCKEYSLSAIKELHS